MAEGFVPYPLTFEPNLVPTVWGGDKLARLYGKPPWDKPVGESWEVSTVPGRESVVANGPLSGQRLDHLCERLGPELLGEAVVARHGTEFPLLLKLIDASQDLSVQVHPDALQARHLGGDARSKSEAWLILHTAPGARLVHGVAPGTTREGLAELIDEGRVEEGLRFVEVAPGDIVPVPPGTLHAIGAGVVLLELQESSDTTYRFYDYGRLGLDGRPRQLHVDEALAVVSMRPRPATATPQPLPGPGRRELLYRDDAVEMQRWQLTGPVEFEAEASRFTLVTNLGPSTVTLKTDSPAPETDLVCGQSAFVPPHLSVTAHAPSEALLFLGAAPV
jgi:mannose-6-phosphate isomerase